MMGRKSKQLNMAMLNMEDLIPQDHLLRKIKADTRDQSDRAHNFFCVKREIS